MKKVVSIIALVLVIVGAINWLLIGLFSFDLVGFIFGSMEIVTRIVYSLVGIAGLWLIGVSIFGANMMKEKSM